jgi:methanogenic corrinoid protein MtbC1
VTGSEGERHALGARFVADFLEGEGWTVVDLGASTPTDDLVRLVAKLRPKLVCLSTAITTNLGPAEDAVAALRGLPVRPLIAIGGHAYRGDPTVAERLGADVYAPDAAAFLTRLAAHLGAS